MIKVPIPSGLKYVSHVVPDRTMQDYTQSTGIWNVFQMRAAERGHLKTLIITTKVLPSAEGKVLTVDPSFQSLVINGVHEEDEIRVLRPATFRVLAARIRKRQR